MLISPNRYAKEILQKEMLPHVGVGEYCETKKAYYFGYVTLIFYVLLWLQSSDYIARQLIAVLPGILFTAFYFVPLAEERRTIGIITAIRGWILLDLCWVVFSGWCVCGYYVDDNSRYYDISLFGKALNW